jgi:hypothetical protein
MGTWCAVAPGIDIPAIPAAPDTTQTNSTDCVFAAADAKAKHTAAVAHWNKLVAW